MRAKRGPLALAFACIMLMCALFALHSQSSASVFFSLFSPDSLTNPPFAIIVSDSMKPTLERGDIAFIRKVDPETIKVGDVVAVWVPKKYQNEYDYPPRIIHRVTKIKEIKGVTYLETKGDNCDREDIFRTPLRNVIGVYSGFKIPYIGLIFLFARSTIGMIYLAIVAITIFLLKYVPYHLNKEKMKEERIIELYGRVEQFRESIQDLSEAISEYAVHLQTHTSVLKNLNSTTAKLKEVTKRLALNTKDKEDEFEEGEIREEPKEPADPVLEIDGKEAVESVGEEVRVGARVEVETEAEAETGAGAEAEKGARVEGVAEDKVRYKEAFKLFIAGNSPLDLVIKYNYSPDEAKLAFIKYKELLSFENEYQSITHEFTRVSKKCIKWIKKFFSS